MKRCPSCNRTYTDLSLNFCLEDGTPLLNEAPTAPDLNATVRYPSPRDTSDPPPTEIYRPETPLVNQAPPTSLPRNPNQVSPNVTAAQQWSPVPQAQPRKKSNAIWWILGGLAVFAVIGVGLVIMIVVLASLGSTANDNNGNANSNTRVIGRSANANVSLNTNAPTRNDNSSNLPASFTDDFSSAKWGVGNSKFGDIWYADDEYHMRSKDKTFLVMYAPSNDYNTENATVKVTARSVDGSVPSAGFGLMVHCEQSKAKQLEDYALLIYPGAEPEYEVITHKAGNQTSVVAKTKSSAIRSGTNPNQLEIRIKGTDLQFYVNGQYLTHITDTENYKRGLAGLYTSDSIDIAFDDLEIQR
jgi:eukaryotic-like serine/threonine-protein kinase